MKTDTELTTKPLPARIGGFALLPSLSPTSPASPNPKNASSLGFPGSAGSPAHSMAGNRTREQIGLSVTQSSYDNLNQLTGQSAGGPLQFSGNLNKPGTVTVGGNPATMGTGSTNFTGTASVMTGTNAVAVVATNVNGNAATNNYQVVVPSGTGTTPTYDANGNMTNNGNGQIYTWDAKNELIKITYTGGATSNFTYDGLNRRINIVEKNSSSAVTSTKQYVWIGNQIAEERDASNTVQKRFFSQGEQQGGTAYYYTRDHLGTIREMVDGSGTIQARYSYDSYGRQAKISGSLDSTFQYTGDYYHTASGLNLTLYRAYDSNTARWLSRDPIKEDGGLNLYSYVGDNPTDYIDPTGLAGFGPDFDLGPGYTGPGGGGGNVGRGAGGAARGFAGMLISIAIQYDIDQMRNCPKATPHCRQCCLKCAQKYYAEAYGAISAMALGFIGETGTLTLLGAETGPIAMILGGGTIIAILAGEAIALNDLTEDYNATTQACQALAAP